MPSIKADKSGSRKALHFQNKTQCNDHCFEMDQSGRTGAAAWHSKQQSPSVLVWQFSSQCHLILSPWKMAVGTKKRQERHIRFSFKVLSIVLTTLNSASHFPLFCIRNYTGTICTWLAQQAPGTHPRPISSISVTQSLPFMLGQRWEERARDQWF